ncbi:MAG: hypothetical protein OEO83_10020 [Alphaproteobacteria bacterium]|nr:hypothetical protein [Alphaproteobacteria bacterium]
MMRTLPLAAAFAALCIGFALPAQSSDDMGDPNMKFFYPDGTFQWEDDREFDRHFDRMEKEEKSVPEGSGAGGENTGSGQSPGDGAAPNSGQPSH